jgi:hypothetical protein
MDKLFQNGHYCNTAKLLYHVHIASWPTYYSMVIPLLQGLFLQHGQHIAVHLNSCSMATLLLHVKTITSWPYYYCMTILFQHCQTIVAYPVECSMPTLLQHTITIVAWTYYCMMTNYVNLSLIQWSLASVLASAIHCVLHSCIHSLLYSLFPYCFGPMHLVTVK